MIEPATAVIRPSDEALATAAQALNAAERVTILAGAGCHGAHDELVALAGALKAPGRPHAARQGVRRVRQPLRRRNDRPARVHVRVPRDGALRRAADARHRLSVPVVLSRRTRASCRWTSAASTSAAGCRSTSGWSARSRTRSPRCSRVWPRPRPAHLDADASHYRRARERLDALGTSALGPRPGPSRRSRHCRGPGRRRRRGVHSPMSGRPPCGRRDTCAERTPPAGRLVQPRVDGQRAAPGDRRPGVAPWTPGCEHLR